MGPILICDKSSIQSLAPLELNMLRKYYSLNIPPVLLVEILGDLKKSEDVASSQREVRQLAEKLVPACSAVNAPFRELIVSEFRGQKIEKGQRPILTGGQHVKSESGEEGVIFDESAEDKALLRWQEGKFAEAEVLMANAWRKSTLSVDLEVMQRNLRSQYSPRVKLRSLDEVVEFVDDLLAPRDSEVLMRWFVQDIALTPEHQAEVMDRMKSTRFHSLEVSAPYTQFCLRGALTFHFALAFGHISTRPTNRVDLEYLYYIPFCDAFSSGDKFHRISARFFLADAQSYIDRDELKPDLKRLANWWEGMEESQREFESGITGPPENEESVTHRLWKKLMKSGYRDRQRLDKTLRPDVLKRIAEDCCRLIESGEATGQPAQGSMDHLNFVSRKHTVRLDGPCFCGSAKTFRDCCGSYLDNT